MHSLEKYLSRSSVHSLIELFVFYVELYEFFVYSEYRYLDCYSEYRYLDCYYLNHYWYSWVNSYHILMLGKIEGRRRRGWQRMIVGWHHWFNGHGLGQTVGDGEGQGGLSCCSPWDPKEPDTTGQLNNNMSF